MAAPYVELQLLTHFSFLRGASDPRELFAAAALLGYDALGVADLNTVAGVVRALDAERATGVRSIPGARLDLDDGRRLLLYPTDLPAWSRLSRLITLGKSRAGKNGCDLGWADVAAWAEGQIAILLPDEADERNATWLGELADLFGDRSYMALSHRRRPDDAVRLDLLAGQARAARVRAVATGDVLYHAPAARLLQEVVTAIREHCTIDELGLRREIHADRALKRPEEMVRRFADFPDALQATRDIADRCRFSLSQLRFQYPYERVIEGLSAQEALERLTAEAAARMFPDGVPHAYADQLTHELKLVAKLDYAPYFLTVQAIVAEARRRGILCQGRGSAANSVICFLLGVTSIDPIRHRLLFERFLSAERNEPPDVDIDFEHERRGEIIEWVMDTYGRDRAALTATVVRYCARGAVRDVGKAMGLPEDVTAALAGSVWGWSSEGVTEGHAEKLNLDTQDRRLRLTLQLARQLIGTPHYLSQHPGGMVLTEDRLDDFVPIVPAAMAERQTIEFDKDDLDALGGLKVDLLGLGMLGCLNRCLDMLDEAKGARMGLADIQDEDPEVFAQISNADTIGLFQIESRAQMSMLPRLKPRCFFDLAIQVAIVRPGPIQGGMVHPYLRRREGLEEVEYHSPELRDILEKTLGVPLFQEQVMQVSIRAGGFTPGEADGLRRSMATFKKTEGVGHFEKRLIEGMVERGYDRDFAERLYSQLEGFGSYGFPESHAASFAKIAYASAWLRHHHPDAFCASLLNSLPMGFYEAAQVVDDARRHGVEVRPVCAIASRWDCTLEPTGGRHHAVRLGLRMVKGLSNAHGANIAVARGTVPYGSIEEMWRRADVPSRALETLAEADAFHALGLDRRQALWQVRGLGGDAPLPLLAAADRREAAFSREAVEPEVELEPLTDGAEVVADFHMLRLSLKAHPLEFLRDRLAREGVTRCADLDRVRDGRHVEVAGLVITRQKPGSARGVLFITLGDESGMANGIIWPQRFEAQRSTIMTAHMVSMRGRVQKEGKVIHVIVDRIVDRTGELWGIGGMEFPHRTGRGDGAKHPGSPDRGEPGWKPKVRDGYWPPHGPGMDPEDVIRVRSHDFR